MLVNWLSMLDVVELMEEDDKDISIIRQIFPLITNIMKYNQAQIADNYKSCLVNQVCIISNSSSTIEVIVACLAFFDALVSTTVGA